jgi:hypothetical protein
LYTFDSTLKITQGQYYYGDFFSFIPHQKRFLYCHDQQLRRVNYGIWPATDSLIYTHPRNDKTFLQPRFAPGNSNIIYTATQQQGANFHFQVFKSMDAGNTWTEFNKQAYDGFLTDIAVDPDDPSKICVGTIEGKVFFSMNSGLSFSPNTLPDEAGVVNSLTYMNSGVVLAACDYGLWVYCKGLFGMMEWRKFNDQLPRKAMKLPNCRITDVEYLPANKLIRAATMGRGVFECQLKKLL